MQRKTIKWRRPTANQDNVKHCNQTESLVLLENVCLSIVRTYSLYLTRTSE